MDCPVCRELLIILEHDAVEVDYCVSCEGIWLDAGELELLFGDAQACAAFMDSGEHPKPDKEKARRCPICRRKMRKDLTRGDAPVTYDRCTAGHGLWFDKGELAAVLDNGATADGERVTEFLRGIFPQKAS